MNALEERFWSKVNIGEPDACWHWKASKSPKGYGRFRYDGRNTLAHQVAWMLANKRHWPTGAVCRHKCDNPPCVNPDHLQPGTVAENNQDALDRRSMNNPWARNLYKTHCLQGHALSGDNILLKPNGYRICRACRNARQRKYGAQRRALAKASAK